MSRVVKCHEVEKGLVSVALKVTGRFSLTVGTTGVGMSLHEQVLLEGGCWVWAESTCMELLRCQQVKMDRQKRSLLGSWGVEGWGQQNKGISGSP